MTIIRFDYKPAGEKLLRLKIDLDEKNDMIREVKIYGDFFIHPEESIDEIESIFKNRKIDFNTLERDLHNLIKHRGIVMVGISVRGIMEGLRKALERK